MVKAREIRTTEDAQATQREAELMTSTAIHRLRADMHCGLSSGSRVTRYGSTASLLGGRFVSAAPSRVESDVEILADIMAGGRIPCRKDEKTVRVRSVVQ